MPTALRFALPLLLFLSACPSPPGEDAGGGDGGGVDGGALDGGPTPADAGLDGGSDGPPPCVSNLDEACDGHELLLCLNGQWLIGTTCAEPSYCHLDGRGNASCAGLEDAYCREDLFGFGPVPCAVGLGCSLGVPVDGEIPGTCVVDPPTCTRAFECVDNRYITLCTEVSPMFRDCGADTCVPDVGCVATDAGPVDAGSIDAGAEDAGAEDAGAEDAGADDAGDAGGAGQVGDGG